MFWYLRGMSRILYFISHLYLGSSYNWETLLAACILEILQSCIWFPIVWAACGVFFYSNWYWNKKCLPCRLASQELSIELVCFVKRTDRSNLIPWTLFTMKCSIFPFSSLFAYGEYHNKIASSKCHLLILFRVECLRFVTEIELMSHEIIPNFEPFVLGLPFDNERNAIGLKNVVVVLFKLTTQCCILK